MEYRRKKKTREKQTIQIETTMQNRYKTIQKQSLSDWESGRNISGIGVSEEEGWETA